MIVSCILCSFFSRFLFFDIHNVLINVYREKKNKKYIERIEFRF